jgi:RNA polymerase sigma-70 factor (ECF subfamily)
MQPIDKDIIIRAAEGDMEAFEEIYRKTSGYVYTIAFRITSSREDAQEATQDVFLSVHKNLRSFRFQSSFKTWIYRIATNMAINMYRKRSKERGRTVVFDETIEIERPEERKTETFDKEHNETIVRNMLDALPPEQKACLVLKEIEGLKYEEIAQTLKININTVRSRLKRAREKLISRYRQEVTS